MTRVYLQLKGVQQMDIINKYALPRSYSELSSSCIQSVTHHSYYFFAVHCLLVSLSMKARPGADAYAKSHPFPSWFICITSCFGGTLLVNLMFAKPIVEIYTNLNAVSLASVIWYLVFFSPLNVVEKCLSVKLVRSSVLVCKELQRIVSISKGVVFALSLYPENFFIVVLVGTIRGSAAKFLLRPLDAFVRGHAPSENEFLKPAFSTKYSVIASLLLFLQHQHYVNIKTDELMCLLFIMAAITQVLMLTTQLKDPFKNVEEVLATILLRGPEEVVKEVKKSKKE